MEAKPAVRVFRLFCKGDHHHVVISDSGLAVEVVVTLVKQVFLVS